MNKLIKDKNYNNINISKNLNYIDNIIKYNSNDYFYNRLVTKYYPSFNKEWYNGIFSYSKKDLHNFVQSDKQASYLIKLVFNSLLKQRNILNLSTKSLKKRNINKIVTSKIKFKHSSSKVTITLFVYNSKLSFFNKNIKINDIKRINKLNLGLYNIYDLINVDKDKNLIKFLSEYLYKGLNVDIKIISLKAPYFNSSLLSEYSGKYLKYQKARYINIKNKLFNSISMPSYNKQLLSKDVYYKNKLSSLTLLNNIKNYRSNYSIINTNLLNMILKTIKFKFIYGINLQMNGRITRRRIAERALSKSFNKGSLKNIDSSFKGKSVYLLRNNVKPNLDYNNYNSKTRNGAFSIKIKISNL